MKSWLQVLLIALVVLVVALVLWPVSIDGHMNVPKIVCLSNLKQLALGLTMCSDDCDGSLPNRDAWMDLIEPYTKRPQIEHCSVVKSPGLYGYALNASIDRLSKVSNPVTTPLVYDSVNLARNASDLVTSLPNPGRHKGANNIAYADGHAKSARAGKPEKP